MLRALHRALPCPRWLGLPALVPLRVAFTFLCVMLGWVLFRARSLGDAGVVLGRLFAPSAGLELAPATMGVLAGVVAIVFAAHLAARFADVEALARRAPAPPASG